MRSAIVSLFLLLGLGAPAIARDTWVIEPARTEISFDVPSAVWGDTHGVFTSFDGQVSIDFDRPERSRVSFMVKTASLKTGSGPVDEFVTSDALLDAAAFPQMQFVATGIRKLDESTVLLTGNLTLRGVTKPVDFKVSVDRKVKGQVGLLARGSLFRTRFGISAGTPVVGDQVTITVKTVARQK
jgi:polyisoprenoid-binding protein YceI